ncbi:MerR family transcriptional regulator [Priestia aryabhattai]|uniref:MerR family transcriptional regulator n=1 Tax=Priestia aryabhattai TaxID=412384 RepID=UPI00288155F0|nr:MerR family transcriptional regulator [Priestia aryabhattai]MDT0147698.1 MerR family transcriptional regulator [Priestia aryabhattai]MDT0154435.1 MerR family transcriptional regulator [Priestia aryabhattai]
MKDVLTIGELAKQANLSTSAIRFYESIGMIPDPKRVNGQRRYTIEALDRLQFIQTAQSAGFNNKEIIMLLDGFNEEVIPSRRWNEMATAKCEELEEKKEKINTMIDILSNGLQCNCLTWSECLSKVDSKGICN